MFPLSPLETESGCIYMERLRLLDDDPVFFDISYIANVNLPRITARSFEDRSLFQILRDHYHVGIIGGEQRLRAIPAPSVYARFLNLENGKPLLHLERKIETSVNGLFLYSSIYCNTKRYSIFGRF
jgi:GntR family transcriptional regulator/GntR family frlABCD operon transcriptional regulator